MVNIALLKKTNANRWQGMRVTAGLVTVVNKTGGRLVDPDAKADTSPSRTTPAYLGLSLL